eukprot:10483052-Alexandrium_andersonii.AAC.1
MSASLVGSEMCIRDSPPHASFKGRSGPLQASSSANLGRPPVASPSPASACLLYTSDAADDM